MSQPSHPWGSPVPTLNYSAWPLLPPRLGAAPTCSKLSHPKSRGPFPSASQHLQSQPQSSGMRLCRQMTFVELTHCEGTQDDRYCPQDMSVFTCNIICVTALFVALRLAGTSGRRAGCVSPRSLAETLLVGNAQSARCPVIQT